MEPRLQKYTIVKKTTIRVVQNSFFPDRQPAIVQSGGKVEQVFNESIQHWSGGTIGGFDFSVHVFVIHSNLSNFNYNIFFRSPNISSCNVLKAISSYSDVLVFWLFLLPTSWSFLCYFHFLFLFSPFSPNSLVLAIYASVEWIPQFDR